MSKLMSAADFQREILAAESMLAEERQLAEQYGLDAASELAILSWENRVTSLKESLAALGDEKLPSQELSLRFEGRPVRGNSVEVPFLATALRNFQTVVTSAVGSAMGRMARSGRFSETLRADTTLRVVETFAGSFGVHLETSVEQLDLEDFSFVSEAVRNLMDLMQADAESEVMDALAPFDARAIANYRHMLEHLKNSGADLDLQWHSATGAKRVRLTAQRAERVSTRLAQFKKTAERIAWSRGVLDGAIKTKGFFQFITEDKHVFSGAVAKSVLEQLRDFYDRDCEALITTTEITDAATGELKTAHRLEKLRHAGEAMGQAA
ncbi:MAG TPA: hypothetical protein VFJ16_31430 [Longimicrobium sp.]|nr:hypothetical protein [Longimicrobium sp.]